MMKKVIAFLAAATVLAAISGRASALEIPVQEVTNPYVYYDSVSPTDPVIVEDPYADGVVYQSTVEDADSYYLPYQENHRYLGENSYWRENDGWGRHYDRGFPGHRIESRRSGNVFHGGTGFGHGGGFHGGGARGGHR